MSADDTVSTKRDLYRVCRMSNLIPPLRKKARMKEVKSAPLPVAVGVYTDVASAVCGWKVYQASYANGIVTVSNASHARALYKNGYFGHGNLSESGINFHERGDVISESVLDRRKEWSQMSEQELSRSKKKFARASVKEENEPILVVNSDSAQDVEELEGHMEEDPFPITEKLHLTLEEAFFLSYALGCLVVTPEGKREGMNIDQMWTTFCNDSDVFPFHYVVYHRYRSEGWIVKPGVKFGVDWLLYPVGPPFYHAQFALKVQSVWSDDFTTDDMIPFSKIDWISTSAFERLCNHVVKAPVLCHVLRPRNMTKERLSSSPKCLEELKIYSVLLSRWIYDQNAETKETKPK
ncbi:tRNA-splicing endonuclease subunit Sen2-like isoform X2 [Oratosquilla oratoria]|uniref:tRNA-splicing endonuclease subunit Sen2-like isoform X2 n=1 Tax=Oratosquilla oratoria TaxID=337810 RepID=UPI003F76D836